MSGLGFCLFDVMICLSRLSLFAKNLSIAIELVEELAALDYIKDRFEWGVSCFMLR